MWTAHYAAFPAISLMIERSQDNATAAAAANLLFDCTQGIQLTFPIRNSITGVLRSPLYSEFAKFRPLGLTVLGRGCAGRNGVRSV